MSRVIKKESRTYRKNIACADKSNVAYPEDLGTAMIPQYADTDYLERHIIDVLCCGTYLSIYENERRTLQNRSALSYWTLR